VYVVDRMHSPVGLAQEERVMRLERGLTRNWRQRPLKIAGPAPALVLAATVLGRIPERLSRRVGDQ
jgi:hypothetical protein